MTLHIGRFVLLLTVCCIPNLALAVTGWAGQREKPDRPFSGHIEEQAFLTYEEAVEWTRGNSSFPLVELYGEYIVEGKRLHLFHRPSQYTPPSGFVGGEVFGCAYWPIGAQASRIHSSFASPNHSAYRLDQLYDAYDSYNHIMYGPDGSFPSGNLAGYNNCIMPDRYTFWRIAGTLSMAVHEVEILIECPVPDLTPVENIPPNGPDVLPLTLELERARGVNILALTPETETARQCLIVKASGIGVAVITTSGTRTIAYQKHFIELWDKMIAHNRYEEDPVVWEACRSRREKVIAEKGCATSGPCKRACVPGSHCIRHRPATRSDHPNGTAFDISRASIDGIKTNLALYGAPQPISGWLASPPPCNLRWGGEAFRDEVHFELGQ